MRPCPTYYVPLNGSGTIAMRLGLHRDLAYRLPETMVSRLKSVRYRYYSLRYGTNDREAKNTSAVVRP